ncbi:MAG: hypothetical protein Ct9H90mP16_07900 [Candidatus Poseidoniales archaeon]|nr:MAG: hypothetical protein Ct9H90mP16_07900 [Candidatus Poseidoniales archaeon]
MHFECGTWVTMSKGEARCNLLRKLKKWWLGPAECFHRLSPELGEFFDSLRDGTSLDLDSRKGKAPGGYQLQRDHSRKPFIFMNATGLQRDLETMVHEAGHAFHSIYADHLPLVDYRSAPIEFCEVAAMSMELLTHDFLDEFYSPEDANRAVREHLEGIVSILAWIATIDAFQHWIYTNPGHTKEERHQQWIELGERFGSILDWSEFEEWRKVGWQRQLHLFFVPILLHRIRNCSIGCTATLASIPKEPANSTRQLCEIDAIRWLTAIA